MKKWLLVASLIGSTQVSHASITNSDLYTFGTVSLVAPGASLAGQAVAGVSIALAGSMLLVTGLNNTLANVVEVFFESSVDGSRYALTLPRKAFEASGVAIGQSIQTSTVATGTLLVASGKVLAFVPNKIGETLLENSRVPQ